jgi:hypothetical protein
LSAAARIAIQIVMSLPRADIGAVSFDFAQDEVVHHRHLTSS